LETSLSMAEKFPYSHRKLPLYQYKTGIVYNDTCFVKYL
jgi:hypothetical protein